MVSLFGRGFDSLQLHYVTPSRGLTLVRVLCIAKRPFGPSYTLTLCVGADKPFATPLA